VDTAAQVLSDILLMTDPVGLVYHLENPIRQSWHDALAALASKLCLCDTTQLEFDEWLDMVLNSVDDASENPARDLADFFRIDFKHMAGGNIILDTAMTRRVSPTLRDIEPVSEGTIVSFITHWKNTGFLK
jgi:hypothetical protein